MQMIQKLNKISCLFFLMVLIACNDKEIKSDDITVDSIH